MKNLNLPSTEGAKDFFQDKLAYTIGPVEVASLDQGKGEFVLVDLRTSEKFQESHVPGAIHLPEERWGSFEGLATDKVNILYCYSHVCHLAARAACLFSGAGYPVMEMDGGFAEWETNKLPIEKGESLRRTA